MNPSALAPIQVWINGESRCIPAGLNVAGLLQNLEIASDRVAVEMNRAIVRRNQWDATPVEAGAQVEIVQFVGGG